MMALSDNYSREIKEHTGVEDHFLELLPPKKQEMIIDAISCGVSFKVACRSVEVNYNNLYALIHNPAYMMSPVIQAFRDRVDSASANLLVEMASCVKKAAVAGDWKAAVWLLQTIDPADYGSTANNPIVLVQKAAEEVKNLTDEQLLEIASGISGT